MHYEPEDFEHLKDNKVNTENKSFTPTSIKDLWQTPKELFNTIDKEFNFVCDVAASYKNTFCIEFEDKLSFDPKLEISMIPVQLPTMILPVWLKANQFPAMWSMAMLKVESPITATTLFLTPAFSMPSA